MLRAGRSRTAQPAHRAARATRPLRNGCVLDGAAGNGDNTTPGRQTWNGTIDEVRIWSIPRGVGEIAASMNQSLSAMPGKTVTFNLDGDFLDSSSGLTGRAFGTINAFVDGPRLSGLYPSGSHYGRSTTTCARTLDITMGSLPTVGNGAFTVWCANAPRTSPLGLFVVAAQQAPVQPPVLGVSLAFTLSSVITSVAYVPGSFGLGLQRQPLPIPANGSLLGLTVFTQFAFSDAQCGPQGISASNGLTVSIQSL